MGLLIRILVNTLAILLAVAIVPGIEARGALTILGAGLVLGLVNAVVRPVLLVLTLPLTLVTLGLFLLVLNGFCLWLTAALVKGFEVHGFWAAVFGAIVVSAVSWVVNAFLSDRGRVVVITDRSGDEPYRRPPRRVN